MLAETTPPCTTPLEVVDPEFSLTSSDDLDNCGLDVERGSVGFGLARFFLTLRKTTDN